MKWEYRANKTLDFRPIMRFPQNEVVEEYGAKKEKKKKKGGRLNWTLRKLLIWFPRNS